MEKVKVETFQSVSHMDWNYTEKIKCEQYDSKVVHLLVVFNPSMLQWLHNETLPRHELKESLLKNLILIEQTSGGGWDDDAAHTDQRGRLKYLCFLILFHS